MQVDFILNLGQVSLLFQPLSQNLRCPSNWKNANDFALFIGLHIFHVRGDRKVDYLLGRYWWHV